MDVPWLPPVEFTWRRVFGSWRDAETQVRAAMWMAGGGLPPAREATAQELRWKAEDAWLAAQWNLADQ